MDYLYKALGFIIGSVFRYRARVSLQNLSRAFPTASYGEIKDWQGKFYTGIARMLLETIFPALQRLLLAPQSAELFDLPQLQGRPIILMTGHYGNWEVVGKLPLALGKPIQALYKPLQNNFWNSLFVRIRGSNGLRLLPSNQALRILIKERNKAHITLFVADQYPGKANGLAIDFLHQPTYMFMGAEQLAKRLDAAVFYMELAPKGKRAWQASFELICENAAQTSNGFITGQYTQKLACSIRQNPACWLWSHKRWK